MPLHSVQTRPSKALPKITPKPKSFWHRWRRYWYLRVLRLQDSPAAVARGLSVGVFAGCFPIFGFQTIFGILFAFLVRGNKIAAVAGTWISNPLTYVPLFAFNYKIGKIILGFRDNLPQDGSVAPNWQSWESLKESGSIFLLALFVGCFFMGLIAAICVYFLSLRSIHRWYHLKREKRNPAPKLY
jgi:uncharacterized protein (DUF2062 family)